MNKRDLPDALPMEMIQDVLDPERKIDTFQAVATDFKGVFEPFRAVSQKIFNKFAEVAV